VLLPLVVHVHLTDDDGGQHSVDQSEGREGTKDVLGGGDGSADDGHRAENDGRAGQKPVQTHSRETVTQRRDQQRECGESTHQSRTVTEGADDDRDDHLGRNNHCWPHFQIGEGESIL